MTSRDIAITIDERVTMRDVCNTYGLKVNGAGFISCPFHSGDNSASLKIYNKNKGWHCFGCGVGGDVIDFVSMYFGIDFKHAIRRINNDFNLNLPLGPKMTEKERREESIRLKIIKAEKEAQEARKAQLEAEYWEAFDEWKQLDRIIDRFKPPKGRYTELHPLYIYALSRIAIVEYHLDYAESRLKEYG